MARKGINRVTILGRLGGDPETRYSQSGNAMTTISVATSEAWKDKDGQMQERTEWHRIKFFGRLAEIAGEYLKKGSQVYIEGSLRTEKYTDKSGVEKYSTDIIAGEMQMIGSAQPGDGAGDRPERPARSAGNGGQGRNGGGYGGGNSGYGGGQPVSASGDPLNWADGDIPF